MEVPFVPMLLERSQRSFADDAWLFQVKWDGVRNLSLIEQGRIRHWSRRLRERTLHFPELDGLVRVFNGQRTVLDGEIIVLRDGKPSFPAVLERDLAGGAPDSRKVRSTPAMFMIFDLLEYAGHELYARPLAERLAILREAVPDAEAWQAVAAFPGSSGPDLFQAVVSAGLEGVVGKRASSPYLPGTRSKDWLKIKRRQRTLAVVCGYTSPVGRSGGLLLGAYHQGRLIYIGRAGSGLTTEQLALIRRSLHPAPRPFAYEPNLKDRFSGPPGPVIWTEPRLTVNLEFTEWTEDLKLRDPVVIGFSTEPPAAARLD